MRVAIDANIFISYLLGPGSLSAPSKIVRAGLAGQFDMVIPEEVIAEIREKVAARPDLAGRIGQAQVDELVEFLDLGALVIRSNDEVPLHPGRDAGDAFFLKSAVLDQVEAIVSGDKDLLAMAKTVAPVWIASPAEFVRILAVDA
jgi:putative PIN family toxin of toxin-antitoxin system